MTYTCWRCRGMGLVPEGREHPDGYHLLIRCGLCEGTGLYPPKQGRG